jgi:6,7-dimethyl-8-ribityllumazine synthase
MAPTESSTGRARVARKGARTAAPITPHRLPAGEEADWEGIQGSADGTGLRIAVACSRFNGNVTRLLLAGALGELDSRGVTGADRTVVWVPGAFELPLAAAAAARSGQYDAVICLGAVIRGETSHYDIIAGQCAAGIQQIQLELSLPVVFGVLTTENLDQALARAGGSAGDKGAEAATTAIEMANVLRLLERARPGFPADDEPRRTTR